MDSIAKKYLEQMKRESGMHTSRSDENNHLSIKNSDGKVIGHMYEDGSIKGTNSMPDDQGKSGALPWLQK